MNISNGIVGTHTVLVLNEKETLAFSHMLKVTEQYSIDNDTVDRDINKQVYLMKRQMELFMRHEELKADYNKEAIDLEVEIRAFKDDVSETN